MCRNKEQSVYSQICMHFTSIYKMQTFQKNPVFLHLELEDLSGTNCYCDDLAMEELRKQIEDLPVDGIHFLDSGNYHYMTRIWMEKVREPFTLVVFDNHTDLQPPAFGGILSCGGWIAASLEELPFLQKVILIGPDQQAYDAVRPEYKERVQLLSREQIKELTEAEYDSWILGRSTEFPVYISVDKDILSETELKTNWNQGEFTAQKLQHSLELIRKNWQENGSYLLGMDVCGEADEADPEKIEESSAINQQLLEFWSNTQKFSAK